MRYYYFILTSINQVFYQPPAQLGIKTLSLLIILTLFHQISWVFLFLYDLSEKQKNLFFGFSQWFWVFWRGGVANTPRHLTYIFDPATNRVKIWIITWQWTFPFAKIPSTTLNWGAKNCVEWSVGWNKEKYQRSQTKDKPTKSGKNCFF